MGLYKAVRKTVIKRFDKDSSELEKNVEYIEIPEGCIIKTMSPLKEGNSPVKLEGYVFSPHWEEVKKEKGELISAEILKKVFSKITDNQIKDLNKCLIRYEINTSNRMIHFFSQIAHETANLKWLKELWGPTAQQKTYVGRMGNKTMDDAFKYRGKQFA